jgi:glycosyltransferase involved in cell wall biosynthesis
MNILRLIPSVNPAFGGPVEILRQTIPVLQELGHLIEVASLDSVNAEFLYPVGCPIHTLGPALTKYGFSSRWIPWLQGNAHKFDFVIIDGIWQFPSFGTWLALRNSSVPYFLYTHGMLDPWFNKAYPLKYLKKYLYWLFAERFALRDARSVIFTCETEKLLARMSFSPYECTESVVPLGTASPSGHSTDQCDLFLQHFPGIKDFRIVLFLGRIHPKKGCDLLIKAFAKVAKDDPDLHLVLAGPDQVGWQSKLQGMANELGISHRITFTGLLQGDLKWGAFYASEVFVLPSHQENFGIAVVEAMACGLPVLISNQVNIWQEIAADQAGLVAPDTLEGTTMLLRQWLGMSRQDLEQMGLRAKECFYRRFEIKQAAQSLVQTLQKYI